MKVDVDIISQAIELAHLLRSHFQRGGVAIHPHQKMIPAALSCYVSQGIATAHGTLNLSYTGVETKATAQCSFTVRPNWQKRSPHLRCSDKWIRRPAEFQSNPDWHVNSDGTLCSVLNDQWEDAVKNEKEKQGEMAAMEFAAFYALNNAKWLLYHHLEGYRQKLSRWPSNWPQWPHYEAGQVAYQEWKRKHRKNL